MIKNFLVAVFTGLTFVCGAQQFVATYSFAAVSQSSGVVDPSPVPQVQGIKFGDFRAIGVSTGPNAAGRFSFTSWPLGAIDGSDKYEDFSGVLSAQSYYEVTLKVLPQHTLTLGSVSFAMRRSATGVRNYSVRSSFDNFTNELAASTGTNTKVSVIPTNVFFWNYDSVSTSSDQRGNLVSSTSFSALTDSLTFRIYGWNAETNTGTFSIDNVSFSGTITDTSKTNPAYIENLSGAQLVRFFPNPNTDGILQIEGPAEPYSLKACDINGVIVADLQCQGTQQISLKEFSPGLYFIGIESPGKRQIKKLVILEK